MSTGEILEKELPCPMRDSSDAYTIYNDGRGYCFSCNGTKILEGGEERVTQEEETKKEITPMKIG